MLKGAFVVMDLQLPLQSVPITTKVVSSNPVHGEAYPEMDGTFLINIHHI